MDHIGRYLWIFSLVALSLFPNKSANLDYQHALTPPSLIDNQHTRQNQPGALTRSKTPSLLPTQAQLLPLIGSSAQDTGSSRINYPVTTRASQPGLLGLPPAPRIAGLDGVHGLIFQAFQNQPNKTPGEDDGSIYFLDFRDNTFHLLLQGYLLEEAIPQKKLLLLSTISEERSSCQAPLLGYRWDLKKFNLLARNYCYGTARWKPPTGVITFQTRSSGTLKPNCLDLSGIFAKPGQEKRIPTPWDLDSTTYCPTNPLPIKANNAKTQSVRTYPSPSSKSLVNLIQQSSSDHLFILQITSNDISTDISGEAWKGYTEDNPLIHFGSVWWSPDSSKFMVETIRYQEYCYLCAGEAIYYLFREDGTHISTISGLSSAYPQAWSPNGKYYVFGYPGEIIVYDVDDQQTYYWNLSFSENTFVDYLTWVSSTP